MGTEAGWRMPRQFHNLIEEHLAARASCGVFDISHTAKFRVTGNGAQDWLEGMFSNDVGRCQDGHAMRTLMLNEEGRILDKLTLLRESAGRFVVLGHPALAETDFLWLLSHQPDAPLEVVDETGRWSAVSLSGPDSEAVLGRVLPGEDLPLPMTFRRVESRGDSLLLARVGLQGDEGFQVFCPANSGIGWFSAFVRAGAVPCGFATRENMRIASGACCGCRDVFGKLPQEVSLESLCSRDKTYIGSVAVAKAFLNPPEKKLVTMCCPDDGDLPEPGTTVLDAKGDVAGYITTACVVPDAGRTLAFGMLQNRYAVPGTRLGLLIPRGQIPVVVADTPAC